MFWDYVQKLIPGLSGVDRLSAVLTAGFGALTDGKMWRSLGWIILGLVLTIIGTLWLMGGIAAKELPDAGSLTALAAA